MEGYRRCLEMEESSAIVTMEKPVFAISVVR